MQAEEMWTLLPYYHGLLPREDVETLLTREGDFLVRRSEETAGQERVFVLSVYVSGAVNHVFFRQRNGLIAVDLNHERGFRTIERFIDSHLETGYSICEEPFIALRQGIERRQWQLAHSSVTVSDDALGHGMFAVVKRGTFTDPTGRNQPIRVAVKMETSPSNKEQIKEFMHEARIMRELHHQNIIKFYGVVVDREPLMIVMELACEGNLINYLEQHKRGTRSKLFMCLGAAAALDHIHCKGIIHCSVGARNCLYSQRMLKITDFGQAHKGEVKIMDEARPVPIRWLAPETMRSLFFTQKSDTWSFGVLCWEIFNDGRQPFEGSTPSMVQEMVLAGERLEFPESTPQMFEDFIKDNIWDPNYHMRHSMSAVYDWLDRHINQM